MENYKTKGRLDQLEAKVDALMNRVASLEGGKTEDQEKTDDDSKE